jgi:hypothetical protein
VGRNRQYVPGNDDIGSILKCEIVTLDGNIQFKEVRPVSPPCEVPSPWEGGCADPCEASPCECLSLIGDLVLSSTSSLLGRPDLLGHNGPRAAGAYAAPARSDPLAAVEDGQLEHEPLQGPHLQHPRRPLCDGEALHSMGAMPSRTQPATLRVALGCFETSFILGYAAPLCEAAGI